MSQARSQILYQHNSVLALDLSPRIFRLNHSAPELLPAQALVAPQKPEYCDIVQREVPENAVGEHTMHQLHIFRRHRFEFAHLESATVHCKAQGESRGKRAHHKDHAGGQSHIRRTKSKSSPCRISDIFVVHDLSRRSMPMILRDWKPY